mgnify:FL=1
MQGKNMQRTMTEERDQGQERRRLLQGMLALGGGVLLAACGHDDDDDDWRRKRVILTDQQAGTETRLVVGQALELRLAVDESLLIYRRGRSSPEMRHVSGPERRTIDGRVYQVWVFAAVIGGHATIRMEYAQNEQAVPARVVEFPVDVHLN